jgi:hypothetical protein
MKFEPHKFEPIAKKFPFLYCVHCGLVPLRNRISGICVNAGCNYEEDKDYKLWVKRGCKF